jgi:hypothetical protein
MLLIIHKFYHILYVWLSKPLKVIFIQRFYGIVLSIIILTPLLNYIYILLGNSIINIYILIVMVSILHDNRFKLIKYKYLKYINKFIDLLKINKNLYIILEYRNIASIFTIIIKKGLCIQYEKDYKLLNYAFNINNIYKDNIFTHTKESSSKIGIKGFIGTETEENKIIITYEALLIGAKITKLKDKDYDSFFRIFVISITSNINRYLEFKKDLIYPMLQTKSKLSKEVLLIYKKLHIIIYLILMVALYYY